MRFHSAICLFLAVTAFISFASANQESKIVGGSKVESIESAPHQVSLQTPSGHHFCGGSIIDDRFILTASHCVEGAKPADMVAVVGTMHLKSNDGQKHIVDKIVMHPKYNANFIWNDIALVRVAEKFNENGLTIQRIPLPTVDTPASVPLKLYGWGLTSFPGENSPIDLQALDSQSIPITDCFLQLAGIIPLSGPPPHPTASMCVTNKNGQGACQGDSGGALVDKAKNEVAGIVSWGVPCAKNRPDIYTRVFYYKKWIGETMKNNQW